MMRFRAIQFSALLSAMTIAGVLCGITASSALAQQASLLGAWSGTGRMVLPSGDVERVRCRVSFRQRSSRTFGMSAVCATASTRIAQVASLWRVSANSFHGQFFNREYDISGSIQITVRGNRLWASLSGGGGSGTIRLSR
jgi:hypothetical protein